jgi:hypothetical protein
MGTNPQTSDWWILGIIAAARLLLPLAIPRYPLPGILASLLLDGLDQTLFQQFTTLPLDGYQGFDKALDIYYLSVAYVSTLRNWGQPHALRIGRFLFYWRLVGVALFELTDLRLLLLVFANTFEYFFIFFEACRLRWDPARMSPRLLVGAAALLWIGIKTPQEYWIHVLQMDTTDWLKTHLFQAPLDMPWGQAVQARPGILAVLLAGAVLVLGVAGWLVARRLPEADRTLALSADAHQPSFTPEQVRRAVAAEASRVVDAALLEKLLLVALVGLSFAQVFPDLGASDLHLAVGLALVVTANTALTHWLARRGFGWTFSLGQFLVMAAVNAGLVLLFAFLPHGLDRPLGVGIALFFALLLTLLVTLFDRYRQVYLMRFGPGQRARP